MEARIKQAAVAVFVIVGMGAGAGTASAEPIGNYRVSPVSVDDVWAASVQQAEEAHRACREAAEATGVEGTADELCPDREDQTEGTQNGGNSGSGSPPTADEFFGNECDTTPQISADGATHGDLFGDDEPEVVLPREEEPTHEVETFTNEAGELITVIRDSFADGTSVKTVLNRTTGDQTWTWRDENGAVTDVDHMNLYEGKRVLDGVEGAGDLDAEMCARRNKNKVHKTTDELVDETEEKLLNPPCTNPVESVATVETNATVGEPDLPGVPAGVEDPSEDDCPLRDGGTGGVVECDDHGHCTDDTGRPNLPSAKDLAEQAPETHEPLERFGLGGGHCQDIVCQ